MRVVALRSLREFWESGHGGYEGQFRAWYRVVDKADWQGFADVRSAFPSVDQVGNRLVFNIAGNRFRLIAAIDYERRGVLIRWIGTHAEYDKVDVRTV